ncbi:hypothetical protein [Aquamicrobium zhengzhouense]|nr:hypothetical protein [Aquamicrobium zhengzhouense]
MSLRFTRSLEKQVALLERLLKEESKTTANAVQDFPLLTGILDPALALRR